MCIEACVGSTRGFIDWSLDLLVLSNASMKSLPCQLNGVIRRLYDSCLKCVLYKNLGRI